MSNPLPAMLMGAFLALAGGMLGAVLTFAMLSAADDVSVMLPAATPTPCETLSDVTSFLDLVAYDAYWRELFGEILLARERQEIGLEREASEVFPEVLINLELALVENCIEYASEE